MQTASIYKFKIGINETDNPILLWTDSISLLIFDLHELFLNLRRANVVNNSGPWDWNKNKVRQQTNSF